MALNRSAVIIRLFFQLSGPHPVSSTLGLTKNMEYELIHQDAAGTKTTSVDRISFLAFVKHATFAGINRQFFRHLPFRYSGLFFEFAPSFF